MGLIYFNHLKAKNAATPATVHLSQSILVGISKNSTKFVLWPVVIKVPALLTTL